MTHRNPMTDILHGLCGKPRRRQPKTRLRATWPDGRTFIVRRRGRYWIWHPAGHGSSHLDMARENLEREGATLVREPIPENERY